jgi:hypothetical protein
MGIKRNDWDFCGIRSFWYSLIILSKTERLNDGNYFFVAVSATRKLATRVDKVLAIWLLASSLIMTLVGVLH